MLLFTVIFLKELVLELIERFLVCNKAHTVNDFRGISISVVQITHNDSAFCLHKNMTIDQQ